MADINDKDVDFDRMVAQEELLLQVLEQIAEALESRGISRKEFAERTGVTAGEVTQRLSGARNLTLRTLSDMLFAIDARGDFTVRSAGQEAMARAIPLLTVVQGGAQDYAPVPRIEIGEHNWRGAYRATG